MNIHNLVQSYLDYKNIPANNSPSVTRKYKSMLVKNKMFFTFLTYALDLDILPMTREYPEQTIKDYHTSSMTKLLSSGRKPMMNYIYRAGQHCLIEFKYAQRGEGYETSLIYYSENINNSLDAALAFMPEFQNLPMSVKEKILNNNIKTDLDKHLLKQLKEQNVKKLNAYVSETVPNRIQEELNHLSYRMKDLTTQYNAVSREYEKKSRERADYLIMDDGKKARQFMDFLKTSKFIKSVNIDINEGRRNFPVHIDISTNPMYVANIDEPRFRRSIDNLVSNPDHRKHYLQAIEDLENGVDDHKIGLGIYHIRLKLSKTSTDYEITSSRNGEIFNRHVITAQCTGTFGTSINEAIRKQDLYSLINLLMQWIQTVNIGDSVGSSTIRNHTYVSSKGKLLTKFTENIKYESELLT